MAKTLQDLQEALNAALGSIILSLTLSKQGELTLTVSRDQITTALTTLRDNPTLAFQQIMDICGVDYPDRPERFEVVYHLLSLRHNWRLRVKITTDEQTAIPSVTSLWPVANWFEREAWDLYGILFSNHPDLRRILTDYEFEGHPMRKEFPLTGFVEMQYDSEQKRVIYKPVELRQEFRSFDFLSPWEGMTKIMLPGDEKAVIPPAEPKKS